MAASIAEIIVLCLIVDWLFRRFHLPGLVGMLLVGVVLGPYALDYLDPDLLSIGADLRLIALLVILLRAGFALQRRTLHEVGRRVLLLAFIPAICEGAIITLAAYRILDFTWLEAALLGSVIAAVSPAVIVPSMLHFNKVRKGTEKAIPTMVMAASSVDDVFVIVVYTGLLGLYTGHTTAMVWQVVSVPVSLVLGIAAGLGIGWLLCHHFDRFNPRATKRVLLIIAIAIMLVRVEHLLQGWVPFAGLVSAMAIGFVILEKREHAAHEISVKLAKIWVFAEIILFALVGAQVNLAVMWQSGLAGLVIILFGLSARALGAAACLTASNLNASERAFVIVSFMPKATVQAAIGAGPLLAMQVAGQPTAAGEIILAIAVLSIVLTAPLGAWAISFLGERVLKQEDPYPQPAQS